MKRVDSHLFVISASIIVFFGSFLPIIAGISIENNQYHLQIIDKNAALHVAHAKLLQMEKMTYSIISSNEVCDDQGCVLFYVFNLYPQGYIVIPAHYSLPPVIAYSFISTFFEAGPVLCELVKTDILQRLIHYSEIPEAIKEENNNLWHRYLGLDLLGLENSNFRQWPERGKTLSQGWLNTKWHQGSPFNDFCPIDLATGKRSVAGCPAVAMAQICNYHETTHNVQFNDSDDYYHAFWGNNYWIDDDYETYDFPSFPELNSYLDNLILHYQSHITLTDDDKASLVFACGIAAEQVYHPNGSGTFGVHQAFQAYQRFAFNDIELLDDNDPDVYERIQDNMKNGLPVHLAVVDEAVTTGHNLVIDGYNTDGFYHLNFGWGGSYDGWYKIPEELPFNLNFLEGVIVDIIDDNIDSNLHGVGVLYWPNVTPGTTVNRSFFIENVGDPGSEIDWEIQVWPDWGDWTFDPKSGEDLTPENGPIKINVSVEVPNRKNKHYNGYVKVVDVDNNANSCLIHISLITPRVKGTYYFFETFLQRHPYAFPLIRYLLNI